MHPYKSKSLSTAKAKGGSIKEPYSKANKGQAERHQPAGMPEFHAHKKNPMARFDQEWHDERYNKDFDDARSRDPDDVV